MLAVELTGLVKGVLLSKFQMTHYGTAADSLSGIQGDKPLVQDGKPLVQGGQPLMYRQRTVMFTPLLESSPTSSRYVITPT